MPEQNHLYQENTHHYGLRLGTIPEGLADEQKPVESKPVRVFEIDEYNGGPAIDDGRDFILLQLAVPADIGVSPGIVEVTLLETGGLGRDMLDTELSPDREETGK